MHDLTKLLTRSKRQDRIVLIVGWVVMGLVILILAVLLGNLAYEGLTRINLQFLSDFPSRFAEKAGIKSAWVGSLLIMLVTALTAIPIGIAAAIYLEEYAAKNWFTSLIEVNISNLASVPSIIYGLMALGLLVYQFHLGATILTGGITLAFLILPIVIVATREALRAIPLAIREAAYGLGASKWQVIRHHLLPYSTGGISTGVIIALSRAIGETAPLVTIGALTYIAMLPPVPFSAKPWLSYEDAGMVVLPDEPLTTAVPIWDLCRHEQGAVPMSRLEPMPTSGVIELEVRPELDEGDSADPARVVRHNISINIDSSRTDVPVVTTRSLAAALDALPNMTSQVLDDGRLHVEGDYADDVQYEFHIVSDSSGVLDALSFAHGGGRYSPTDWLSSPFTVLPIQMFYWISYPGDDFRQNAAATGVVLMVLALSLNGVAIVVRVRMRRRIKW